MYEIDDFLMSSYIHLNSTTNNYGSNSWTVLTDIERRIKEKIEKVGTPLKDWDIQINYGIKTGFNDAFIIDGAKRKELIEKHPKSEEIIRPILRGRDIKRYKYEFADYWLIETHNGNKKSSAIDVISYPAIKEHLDQFFSQLSKRQDKGVTPYNLRNCAYYQDFYRKKIVWAELARTGNAFAFDDSESNVLNTCYILTINNHQKDYTYLYLLSVLNSKITLFYMNLISSKLDDTGWRWLKQFVERIPIPEIDDNQQEFLSILVKTMQSHYKNASQRTKIEKEINTIIYEIYAFNEDEIAFVENFGSKSK